MFIADELNNMARRCSLSGDELPRQWEVLAPALGGGYMLRHVVTSEVRPTLLSEMRNLY
ncbi:hypothetical protein N8J89_07965 [Crossiella sp. CA-258035]|uniref:hypothetical protein n=1 Tax=Crossiella sp. CA-258035 TaxID=2981138 RepID=UPI0024BCB55A|nr:hypothetical protein [Crossiella sp. CA-258035]WHT20990.1 hypothetical protein N8J89_07965 [Crossiella sp. CA-258035]